MPTAAVNADFRPHARAGAVHGQSSARLERHAGRQQRYLQRHHGNGQKICSIRPAYSATSRRSIAPKKGLLGPEFQIYSTQTAADRADIVNSALYGTLDKGTTVNLAPFVAASRRRQRPCSKYIGCVFLHGSMSAALQQGGYRCGERGRHADWQSAGRALRRSHFGRIPDHSVRK